MNTLKRYIGKWQKEYNLKVQTIPLFSGRKMTPEEKKRFALLFYHARGHFGSFLFTMGSIMPRDEYREIVLKNMSEEFGLGTKKSHEKLYWIFGESVGADIPNEILEEKHYLPFLRYFNRRHITWLIEHHNSWICLWAAFAAYELLDNVDYRNLYHLASNFDIPDSALLFFKIHREVTHFDEAFPLLEKMWDEDPVALEEGFTFIAEHQIKMWRCLSDAILHTQGETRRHQ